VHFFRYNKADNKLYCFADDVHPRYITAMTPLDYDTVAAGDKFGNFFVLRLPADVSAQVCVCAPGQGSCWQPDAAAAAVLPPSRPQHSFKPSLLADTAASLR
jgi:hypothetical protein